MCVVLVCLDIFFYVGYSLVCLSMFGCDQVCLSTFFDFFFMLCSLLHILAHHVWVNFSKSTLLYEIFFVYSYIMGQLMVNYLLFLLGHSKM